VGAEHDVGIEHRHERGEVALARGGEIGVDDRALAGQVRIRRWRRLAHAPAPAARELAGGLR
jgi:hypothetical protein